MGRRQSNFTLIELFLSISLIALIGSLTLLRTKPMLDHYQMNHSYEKLRREIIPSIMASAAVPGVFNPIFYKGRYLVDGGIVDPIPVRIAKKYGAHVIIAVDVGEDLSSKEPSHFFAVARRGLEISHRKLSEYVTQDADVVIRMNFQGLGIFSDSYNQEIYEHGRKRTRAMLSHIEQLIQEKLLMIHEETCPSWTDIDLAN